MGIPKPLESCLCALLALALGVSAWAIDPPLRDPSGLAHPKKEKMVRVGTARVILADYDLLKKDFPELRDKTDAEIDQWLLDQAAYVSKAQAAQEAVNTKIAAGSGERTAYRPTDYGRAAVFKAGSGLIDAKGTGALNPAQLDHGNGLATLGETIREYAYEKLVNRVLRHDHGRFTTVGCYAVIDLGFDIKHADGSTSPAGVVLRQAHTRSTAQSYSGWDDADSLEAEKTLRKYGITSAGADRSYKVEKMNIQGTRNGGIVDFGGFLVVERFDKPVRNWDTPGILLRPGTAGFPEPEADIRVPFDLWGYSQSGKADPKFDNPWLWSHELAENLRKGTATRADAEQHLRNLLGPVESRLSAHPGKAQAAAEPACMNAFQSLGAN